MKILVDTHVLIWWVLGLPQLGPAARGLIADPVHDLLFSPASPWEMAIKIGRGRLHLDVSETLAAMSKAHMLELAFNPQHYEALIGLPAIHRDPFDRMLVAQALVEGAVIMTADEAIRRYPVRTIGCD